MTLQNTNYEIENADVYRTDDCQYRARVTICGPEGDKIKRIGKPYEWHTISTKDLVALKKQADYQIGLVMNDLVKLVKALET